MQFNTKNKSAKFTKREQDTLNAAHDLLNEAGRILGNDEAKKAAHHIVYFQLAVGLAEVKEEAK